MTNKIYIYIEHDNDYIAGVSLELINKANSLIVGQEDWEIEALIVGVYSKQLYNELSVQKINKLAWFNTDRSLDINFYANVIADYCKKDTPEIMLFGATKEGRAVAPLIAAKLQTGLTADCTELKLIGRELLQIRPAYGESLLAHIKTSRVPQMATVRPGIMAYIKNKSIDPVCVDIRNVESTNEENKIVLLNTRIKERAFFRISDASKVMILGAGINSIEQIEILKQWAESLGMKMGCSRKLVERGWFDISHQIGLSGNVCNADIALIIGVSGSVQFQAGIKNIKNLIAINNDKEAPIFQVANSAIILDLEELISEIKERLNG